MSYTGGVRLHAAVLGMGNCIKFLYFSILTQGRSLLQETGAGVINCFSALTKLQFVVIHQIEMTSEELFCLSRKKTGTCICVVLQSYNKGLPFQPFSQQVCCRTLLGGKSFLDCQCPHFQEGGNSLLWPAYGSQQPALLLCEAEH